MRVTKKQTLLITAIGKINADESFLDINQVLDSLAYETTKQSLQFSLRALIRNGFVEKRERECRRGQSRVVFSLTKEGYRIAEANAAVLDE